MPPPPLRTEIVRPVADDWIDYRVRDQRNGQRQSNSASIEANNLAIEGEQEDLQSGILDAERGRTEAVDQLRAQRGLVSCDDGLPGFSARLGQPAPQ
jgi:hypothetical protein